MAETNGYSNGNGNSVRLGQWVLPAVTAAAVLVGALITFFVTVSSDSSQVTNQGARIASLEQNYNHLSEREITSAALAAQVAANAARLSAIEQNFNQMAEREMILRTTNATMTAKLLEIETQFCGEDHIRNLTQAQNLRLVSLMWKKLFPESESPAGDSYYPSVCNRNPEGSLGGRGG